MSTQIEFNSNFLSALNQEWKGIFYDKFISAYSVLQNAKSLKSAVEALFPYTSFAVAKPPDIAFKNFGKGNFARDAEVLQFLDKQFWGRLSLKDAIIPEELLSHSTLKRYQVLQNILQGKDVDELPLKTLEDLSFLGCIALIQSQQQVKKNLPKLSNIANYNIPEGDLLTENPLDRNYLTVDSDEIVKIATEQESSIPNSLEKFIACNKGLIQLQEPGAELNNQIPEILFASGELWQQEVFSFNPTEVESMDFEQKVHGLIANKSKVLQKCFEQLLGKQSQGRWGPEPSQRLQTFILSWNELAKSLEHRDIFAEQLYASQRNKEAIKKRFVGIAGLLGASEKQAAIKLIELIAHQSNEIEGRSLTDLDRFLLHIASSYKKQTIAVEGLKQDLKNIDAEIDGKRTELMGLLEHTMNAVTIPFSESARHKLDLLKVYATFVFVLDNESVFPTIAKHVKTARYKQASNILKQFIGKPFERLKKNSDPFQELFNPRITAVLKPYKKTETIAAYRQRGLTQQELSHLTIATQRIQEALEKGDRYAIAKYQKLEAVINELLQKDHAFQVALTEERNLSPDRLQALQAHFYACSLLATTPKQGGGQLMQQLLQKVSSSITDRGIKESIVKNTAGIIKAAEALGVTVPEESVEEVVKETIVGRNYESLGDFAAILLENPPSKNQALQIAQEKVREYVADISKALNGAKTWFGRTFYDLKNPLEPNFSQRQVDAPLSEKFYAELRRVFPETLPPHFPRTVNEALRQLQICIIENNITITPDHPLKVINTGYSIREEGELLAKAFAVNELNKKLKLASTPTFDIVPKSSNPQAVDRQIDLFDNKTLFQFYNESGTEGERNEQLSEKLYHEFLPIFVSSFINIEGLFGTGVFNQNRLMQTKASLIKKLPGSEAIVNDIVQFLETNSQKIHALQTYLEKEVQRQSQELSQNPETLVDFIGERIKSLDFITPAIGWVKDGVLLALKSSIVAFLTLRALQPYINMFPSITHPLFNGAVVYLSFLGVKFAQDSAIPFLKKSLSTAWEYLKSIAGIREYGIDAPMECLLNLLDLSLNSELGAINQIPFLDNRALFCSYMQSTFNAVEELSYNLANFGSRLNQLVPPYETQTNFSVMVLNMIFYFTSEVMRVLPQELLRTANHPRFIEGVKDYLNTYKAVLDDIGKNYRGTKELRHDAETGYERYLQSEVAKRATTIHCSANSAIGQCLGGKAYSFRLMPQDIIPYQEIDTEATARQLELLVNRCKDFSDRKKRSQEKIYPVVHELQQTKKNALFHEKDLEKYALTLLSSYEIVVDGFQMAKALSSANLGLNLEEDRYLKGINESPRSIFTSRLFQDALSFLENTFHSLVAIGNSTDDLRDLNSLKHLQKEFLETNVFTLPPFWLISKLRGRIREIAQAVINRDLNVNGSISFAFTDLKLNPKFQVPVIVWTKMKTDLLEKYGENAREVQKLLETSPLLYLTGEGNELLFASPELRGSQFSFWVINALEKASMRYHNVYIDQLRRRQAINMPIPKSVTARMPYMQQYLEDQAVPEGEAPRVAPLYPSQRWIQPQQASQIVDDKTGLAPIEYNPEGTNLSPQSSMQYYGQNLPEGVRRQIQQQFPQQRALTGIPKEPQVGAPISQNSSQLQQQNALPILMDQPMEEQAQQSPSQEGQEVDSGVEQPVMVGIDTSGASRSFSGGSNVYDNQFSDNLRQQAEESRQRVQEWQQNAPSVFPQPSGQPYVNPINQEFNPMIVPQERSSFDWATTAKIGAGAALGAGLLGYALSGNKKRGRRK